MANQKISDSKHSAATWEVEIFRAGTFQPMQGGELTFSDDDLRDIAASYDPKLSQAPVVVGHPRSDDPAFGWVSRLEVMSGRLVAKIEKVAPELIQLVNTGRYRKISAAFFGLNSKANPCPGQYYLRHVGLLGAAAPAVPGLRAVGATTFADDARDITVEFSFPSLTFDSVLSADPEQQQQAGHEIKEAKSSDPTVELFQSLRQFFFETYGTEAAARALPLELIGALDAKSKQHTTGSDKMFSEGEDNFATREAALRLREDQAFLDNLVARGKPLGGEIGARALKCLTQLGQLERDAAFASRNDDLPADSHYATLRALLEDLPSTVPFGELALREVAPQEVAFAAPPGCLVDPDGLAIHGKILAWQHEHPGTNYSDAALQVCKAL